SRDNGTSPAGRIAPVPAKFPARMSRCECRRQKYKAPRAFRGDHGSQTKSLSAVPPALPLLGTSPAILRAKRRTRPRVLHATATKDWRVKYPSPLELQRLSRFG